VLTCSLLLGVSEATASVHSATHKEKPHPDEDRIEKVVVADMDEINDWLTYGWVRLPVKFNSWRQNLEDNLSRPQDNRDQR
jgi:hypothetical protein